MRNLIIFIRRYFNLFLFLILVIFCLSLVFQRNDYQRVSFINSANGVTGYFFRKYNGIQYYFHLKRVNDSLVEMNARLLNELPGDFAAPDTSALAHRDSTGDRQYLYLPAEVVNNSVNSRMNYLTLYRGSAAGVAEGMGVIGPNGVVGIVRKVSPHYAVVMSLLHKDASISVKLLRSGSFGTVRWEGAGGGAYYGILKDIPKNVTVHPGDTVITSGYSAIFPAGLTVGYVDRISQLTASNFYRIRIRFATHFRSLQYVFVIRNYHAAEQHNLESSLSHE